MTRMRLSTFLAELYLATVTVLANDTDIVLLFCTIEMRKWLIYMYILAAYTQHWPGFNDIPTRKVLPSVTQFFFGGGGLILIHCVGCLKSGL